jgi:hypothetical protein
MEKCKRHKGYRGISKPRSTCEDCWKIYFLVNKKLQEVSQTQKTVFPNYYKHGESGETHYCSKCGSPVEISFTGDVSRLVCDQCAH